MTKLEELQKENRKFIIMANNPTAKTYEEALEMELGFWGCEVILQNTEEFENCPIKITYESIVKGYYTLENENQKDLGFSSDRYIKLVYDGTEEYVRKIIGKPLTLNRVLISLKDLACNLRLLDVDENYNIVFIKLDNPFSDVGKFYWDLTKETLEEQSEETQKEINRIINSN